MTIHIEAQQDASHQSQPNANRPPALPGDVIPESSVWAGRFEIASRGQNSLQGLVKTASRQFNKNLPFNPADINNLDPDNPSKHIDAAMETQWNKTRELVWESDKTKEKVEALFVQQEGYSLSEPEQKKLRNKIKREMWAGNVVGRYFTDEASFGEYAVFFTSVGSKEEIMEYDDFAGLQDNLRRHLSDNSENGFFGKFCMKDGSANMAREITKSLDNFRLDSPQLFGEIKIIRKMIYSPDIQRFLLGIFANEANGGKAAADAFTTAVETRISKKLEVLRPNVIAQNPAQYQGGLMRTEPAMFDYLQNGLDQNAVRETLRRAVQSPALPPPVRQDNRGRPVNNQQVRPNPTNIDNHPPAQTQETISLKELEATEQWMLVNPQTRKIIEAYDEFGRWNLIAETAKEERRQKAAIQARFPKNRYTSIPQQIRREQWERQQNQGMLSGYAAAAINALRGLNVHAPYQTESFLIGEMANNANEQFDEYIEKHKVVSASELGAGFMQMAGGSVDAKISSSVLEILEAVENGAAAVVPLALDNFAAIYPGYPGSQIYWEGDELRVQVVDSISGIRDIPVEVLIKSQITMQEAAGKIFNPVQRLASPALIIEQRESQDFPFELDAENVANIAGQDPLDKALLSNALEAYFENAPGSLNQSFDALTDKIWGERFLVQKSTAGADGFTQRSWTVPEIEEITERAYQLPDGSILDSDREGNAQRLEEYFVSGSNANEHLEQAVEELLANMGSVEPYDFAVLSEIVKAYVKRQIEIFRMPVHPEQPISENILD